MKQNIWNWTKMSIYWRLACILRNPPEDDDDDDDDEEQIRNIHTALPIAAIEAPPIEEPMRRPEQYDRERF